MKPASAEPDESSSRVGQYKLLSDELIRLHLQWNMFKALFLTTQSQIDLISSISGNFFGFLHYLLIDHVVLGISRMTDHLDSGKHRNFSLKILVDSCDDQGQDFRASVESKLSDLDTVSSSIRTRRNRLIAHRDMDIFLAVTPPDSISVTYDEIEHALELMRDLLNHYGAHFGEPYVYYEGIVPENVNKLLLSLRKAAEYDAVVTEGLIPRDRLRQRRASEESSATSLYFPGLPREKDS